MDIMEIVDFLARPLLWVLKQFAYWVFKILFSEFAPETYASISNMIPVVNSELVSLDSTIGPYMGIVYQWVPLEVASLCIITYIEYIIGMITIKLTIKLFVPMVG